MAYPGYRLRLAAIAILAAAGLAACNDTTVFRSNFDQTPVDSPPAAAQGVGTGATAGGAGNVKIAAVPGLPGRWVSIRRPQPDSNVSAFQGQLIEVPKEGRYTFSATMLMPTGAGVSTIQFERAGQPVDQPQAFLHLDFMPNNQVRIDDNAALTFGGFPRDKPFIVQVTLNTGPTPTAHIVLSGEGASGTADRTVPPPFIPLARQFGAVRIWMGFPHLGEFKAANVAVTRRRD